MTTIDIFNAMRTSNLICGYLEDVERLMMSDPLHATPIDGEDAVTLLDAPIPVSWTARQHLVNLQWTKA